MTTYKHRFITDPSESDIVQIRTLYDAAGWWDPNDDGHPDLIRRIIKGSHCFLTVKEGDTIIAMGRAISDGVNDAYLQDIVVLPAARHLGVGTKIVEKLIERLRLDGLRWIGLIAGGHSHLFYRKIGFMEMPFSTPMLLKDSSPT